MDIGEFVQLLNGREYGSEITAKEEQLAKELGLVVVFGYSDDNMEFRGAISDEFGYYEGGTAFVTPTGLLQYCEDECVYYEAAKKSAHRVEAVWESEGYRWTYVTDIPDARVFDILEDGEKYCRGIVFKLPQTPKPQPHPTPLGS